MADPIIQDQNQNVQNVQNAQNVQNPEMPQTATSVIDFDLNLPTDEAPVDSEETPVSLDFSDLGNDEPVINEPHINAPVAEAPVAEISVIEAPIVETPVAEVPVIETPIIETPVVEAPVVQQAIEQTTPVIEVKEDNRLDQEDALIEEKKAETVGETTPVIEAKEIPEIKEESLNMFSETAEKAVEEPVIETPVIEAPVEQPITQAVTEQEMEKPIPGEPQQNFPPTTSLQQDQAIIQQLQQSAGKPIENIPVVRVAPTATEVNLDDLLSAPAPTTANQIPVQTNIPAPIPQMPAFTGIQGYSLPPIAAQISQQIKQPLNKKILINFGIGIGVLLVGIFMFKTMYPIEYQNLVGTKTSVENTIGNGLISATGTTDTGLAETTATDGLFENPALANYHAAADESGASLDNSGFNAFEDIETTMVDANAKTKDQLQNYIDQGKKYLVVGKKTKDKDITKYSLFLYKKASALLLDIENGTQISTDDLNTQLADFETYLQKLTGTGANDQILSTQPTPPTPEEFFWSENSWATQTESITAPETTTDSWTTIQEETQTPDEILSGDTNTGNETNDLNW